MNCNQWPVFSMNKTSHRPNRNQIFMGKKSVHLHVTAFSGHCNVLSVAKICFNDFHARFLLPIELSSRVAFLKTGNGLDSVILCVRNKILFDGQKINVSTSYRFVYVHTDTNIMCVNVSTFDTCKYQLRTFQRRY